MPTLIKIPKHNLIVACSENASDNILNCNLVLSVTDTPPQVWVPHLHWYPINEMSNWGYGPFFWMFHVMLAYHRPQKGPTLIHCSGGINRSPTLTAAWLLSQGENREYVEESLGHGLEMLKSNMYDQTVPHDVGALWKLIEKNPGHSLMSHLIKMDAYTSH